MKEVGRAIEGLDAGSVSADGKLQDITAGRSARVGAETRWRNVPAGIIPVHARLRGYVPACSSRT